MKIKKEIPRPIEEYHEIKTKELQRCELNEELEEKIRRFRIGHNIERLLILLLFGGGFSGFLAYVGWNSNMTLNEFGSEFGPFYIMLCFVLSPWLITMIPQKSYCKAQIGILNSVKWEVDSRHKSGNSDTSIEVLFPEYGTYIRYVQVRYALVKKAQKGDKVLVVSFNGRGKFGLFI